jgi:hypothetical protein
LLEIAHVGLNLGAPAAHTPGDTGAETALDMVPTTMHKS